MRLGIAVPSFAGEEYVHTPHQIERFVQRAEEYGFAGAWTLEHLLVPPSYSTSWLDTLATLSHVAGATDTIELGTSVLLLPLHRPVHVAKRAATVQHLSEGRLTLGLGLGYSKVEFEATGVPRAERSPRFTEGVELLMRLFDEEEVSFDGDYYSVTDFRLEPPLVRRPKVLAGGGSPVDRGGYDDRDGSPANVREPVKNRIATADGWISAPRRPSITKSDWEDIAAHVEARGGNPDDCNKYIINFVHLVPDAGEERVLVEQRQVFRKLFGENRPVEFAEENYLLGTVQEIKAQLEPYAAQNFDQMILIPAASAPNEQLRQLDLIKDHLMPEHP